MKTRSIGVVIPSLIQHGGGERVALRSSLYLAKQGHSITLYTCEYNAAYLQENGCGHLDVVLLSGFGGLADRMNGAPERWAAELGAHDIFITHLFPANKIPVKPQIAFLAEPLRELHDLEHEAPFWEDDETKALTGRLTKQIPFGKFPARLMTSHEAELTFVTDSRRGFTPDLILANSHRMRQQLAALYPASKIEVLYPACDPRSFNREDLPEFWPQSGGKRGFRALLVAAIAYHKRWRLAVEAVAAIPWCELVVVGQGPEIYYAEQLIKDLRAEDRIRVVYQVTDSVLKQIMAKVDVGILCSLREPFGMAAVEISAHGLPVILDSDSGAAEVLGSACLAVQSDVQSIARALMRLATDTALYTRLAREGAGRALALTWEDFNRRFELKLQETLVAAHADQTQRRLWPALSYSLDFRRDMPERFLGHCPVLGRYSSHEGWVVEQHFSQLEKIGAQHIVLMARTFEGEVGQSLRAAQRLMDLAAGHSAPFVFSLGLRLTAPHVDQTVIGIARFWAAFRSAKKAVINGRGLFILQFPSKIPSTRLDPITTNIQGLQIVTVAGEVLDDGRHLMMESWLNAPIYRVNEDLAQEDVVSLLREPREDPLIIDGFNDFPAGHFLEPVVQLDL